MSGPRFDARRTTRRLVCALAVAGCHGLAASVTAQAQSSTPSLHVLGFDEAASRAERAGPSSLSKSSRTGALVVFKPMPSLMLTVLSTWDGSGGVSNVPFDAQPSLPYARQFATQVTVANNFQIGAFRLTPSIAYGYQKQSPLEYDFLTENYSAGPSQVVHKVTLGQEIAYRLVGPNGFSLEPYAALHRQWAFNVAGDPSLLDTATPADDFGFRLSTGVALASQALSLRLAAYHNIGGIGDRDSGITAVLSLSLN